MFRPLSSAKQRQIQTSAGFPLRDRLMTDGFLMERFARDVPPPVPNRIVHHAGDFRTSRGFISNDSSAQRFPGSKVSNTASESIDVETN
jgi:hypothetical protein